MRSSYSEEDVILLLKDITGMVEPQPAKVREKLIQSGKHYSERYSTLVRHRLSVCSYRCRS